MKHAALAILALTAALAIAIRTDASPPTSTAPAVPWEVHFSPNGGCAEHVALLVTNAHLSVRQAAYSYTSDVIVDALVAAKLRGLDVQVLIDRAWAHRPQVERLRAANVTVWTDSRHAIMHDKFVVVDGQLVETGSFNYTSAAERSNAENCLTIYDPKLAKLYAANWIGHTAHSQL